MKHRYIGDIEEVWTLGEGDLLYILIVIWVVLKIKKSPDEHRKITLVKSFTKCIDCPWVVGGWILGCQIGEVLASLDMTHHVPLRERPR